MLKKALALIMVSAICVSLFSGCKKKDPTLDDMKKDVEKAAKDVEGEAKDMMK